MAPDANALAVALNSLPPRQTQLLLARTGPTPAGPEWYGVTPAAFDLALWRALTALEARLAQRPPPVEPFDAEERQAAELGRALATSGSHPLANLLLALRANAPAIRLKLQQLAEAAQHTPLAKAKRLVFQVGFAVLVAVSALLYLTHEPQLPPWLSWLKRLLGL